jgi:hypothetical protein
MRDKKYCEGLSAKYSNKEGLRKFLSVLKGVLKAGVNDTYSVILNSKILNTVSSSSVTVSNIVIKYSLIKFIENTLTLVAFSLSRWLKLIWMGVSHFYPTISSIISDGEGM